MNDFSITIVDEYTKRLSKNLAITHIRRQTITIQDDPNKYHQLTERATNAKTPKVTASSRYAPSPPISSSGATKTTTILKTNGDRIVTKYFDTNSSNIDLRLGKNSNLKLCNSKGDVVLSVKSLWVQLSESVWQDFLNVSMMDKEFFLKKKK